MERAGAAHYATEERMMFLPIAFVGRAGAGKTTAATLLATHWGYTCRSIANPLKDVALQLWGPGADRDRRKLQELGKAVRRIEEDTWIDLCVNALYATNPPNDTRVVVDDVRFPNEVQQLGEHGFVFVRIEAPDAVRIERLQRNGKLQDVCQLEDESEVALDDFTADYTIANTQDTWHLLRLLTDILNKEVARV